MIMEMTLSKLYGFRRCDFRLERSRRRAYVALPEDARRRSDGAWVWYAPTFIDTSDYTLPKPRQQFYLAGALDAGLAVAGVDVGESWGAPWGREIFTEFYETACSQFNLCKKACLMPQSRGGLMLYTWAAEHPECVARIAAIYPVCDMTRQERLTMLAATYGTTPAALMAEKSLHHPIDRIGALASFDVPLMNIHGRVDDVVPFETNSEALVAAYRAAGGRAELIEVPDKGHEEVDEFFTNPRMLDFLINGV